MGNVSWSTSTARDVAAALINRSEHGLDQIQLQKMLYLVQAAHLAWFDEPAFDEPIQAWIYGPVTPSVNYQQFGPIIIEHPISGNEAYLSTRQLGAVDEVLGYYDSIKPFVLANMLKKSGMPWPRIREGMEPTERSDEEIPVTLIRDYHRTHGLPRKPDEPEPTEDERALAERVFAGDREAFKELARLKSPRRDT